MQYHDAVQVLATVRQTMNKGDTLKKKFLAGGLTALLATAALVGGVATSASAHTGDLDVTAVCNPGTGQYDLTATLTIAQTEWAGDTMWKVGDATFTGTPTSASGLTNGPVHSTGPGKITLGKFSLPGTTTGKGPWVYAFTTWADKFTKGSDGQLTSNLKGDCAIPTSPTAAAEITVTDATCTADGTASWSKLVHATGGDLDQTPGEHSGTATGKTENGIPYVFPGGSATKQVPYTIPAKLNANAPPCYNPPTNKVCTEIAAGPVGTNLNGLWQNVDTRSSGHYEYVEDGLHVWTDDATSQAKVSLGTAASFPLKDTGALDLQWSGSTPPPGINLFVNFGADGNGTLVYESVYGQDLWLTNGSSAAVKANAPVNGGGNGSQWHGTIDQWLTKYPDAQVTGIAFSLGSGVKGDGTISGITVNCQTYTFDYVEKPAPPKQETETKHTDVTDCYAGTVTTTYYERHTGEPTYDPETNTWTQGEWSEWAQDGDPVVREATSEECPLPPDEVTYGDWSWMVTCDNKAGDSVPATREVTTVTYGYNEQGEVVPSSSVRTEEGNHVVMQSEIDALDCPVTPTPTPTPTPDNHRLAVTGGGGINPWVPAGAGFLVLAGLIALGFRTLRRTRPTE